MMLVITLALLPLGIIALLASLQSANSAERQRRAMLEATLYDGAQRLGATIALDNAVLSSALNAIHEGADPQAVCDRVKAIFASRLVVRPYALFTDNASPLCASPGFAPGRPALALRSADAQAIISERAVEIDVPARASNGAGVTSYTAEMMGRIIFSAARDTSSSIYLDSPQRSLTIAASRYNGFNPLMLTADVGQAGLRLRMTAPPLPFGAADALLAFLPFLMWGSAAAIGFIVVDRVLIKPLIALRAGVAAHARGEPFPEMPARTPAREIGELAETFASFVRTQDASQQEIADALARQTELTREVHHRVKNNLQVVASLISLHARATASPEAKEAYAAIQRRVDALAVVHRNHYAERDARVGIELRPILSEVATGLRASFANPVPTGMTIVAPPVRVAQDVGVAVAFLLTELGELALSIAPAEPVAVEVDPTSDNLAQLSVTSRALRTSPELAARLDERYARVMTGLARQLRASLDTDAGAGTYCISIPTIPPQKKV